MNGNFLSLQALKQQAAAQNAQWPQYKGHFENYILVRVLKTIRTKMGVAFHKGEVTIAEPAFEPDATYGNNRTVYSFRNQIKTVIAEYEVEVLNVTA